MVRRKMDEKGVSPVIGVILMVAITVILAAVIASFVFGMSNVAPAAPPSAQLQVRTGSSADTVELKHMGGDPINCTSIKVLVNGKEESNALGSSGGCSDNLLKVGETETITLSGYGGQYVELTLVDIQTNKPILMTHVTVGG
ncbi:type IV pilin [Archaeoglobus fulgidus]|uniref:Uncharacterized protein AF_1096 n=1 Tax=Archaeoglobus fulgidus (strain ATCC 49558 / DSM 4304 / JCM 9628 / NBRC 100126 / VC-16) TaxID=224325 RepID=Y1096_ARCFU|nr:type IV pilin [Archaeoglobus fulgidus]O29169.1 RecName: Full=Uncharacterized protein AF_1096 [Archaeoglobus fulgidus DSM 4304]AAB90161.1 predicted coding region AF_1096 [Archaeoglobus fulgidus DSM 4304]